MNDYYLNWRLKLNQNKTEVSAFHLNNRMSNKIVNITFNYSNRSQKEPKIPGSLVRQEFNVQASFRKNFQRNYLEQTN